MKLKTINLLVVLLIFTFILTPFVPVFAATNPFMHVAVVPTSGTPTGTYTGEFTAGSVSNTAVSPSSLPLRPFLGTETYWINAATTQDTLWLKQLELDFLRVEVDASDVNTKAIPAGTTFNGWTQAMFESGSNGLTMANSGATVVNMMNNYTGIVKFPYMMMMHYGDEGFMSDPPISNAYAEYVLATIYYYNVIKGMNIKYWEILNEPDWGWTNPCNPTCYAQIFQKVATVVKNHPDSRVNSVLLGGPALGSGDPIDGTWPDGYANMTSDGERQWRSYMPTLFTQGSRSGQFDIGFLSWHDYGSDTWSVSNNQILLNNNYAIANRVNAFYNLAKGYTPTGIKVPDMVISEQNFAAGTTLAATKTEYKNFYANLWSTSTLNNYFSTGKAGLISHFYWKGNNNWPKGLIYQDTDSGNQLVRNPVWWAYYNYIQHTQNRILASQNSHINRWADAIATTDDNGQMIYLIAVNKNTTSQTVDMSFDVPSTLLGNVWVSKHTMVAGGSGTYGSNFAQPVEANPYQYQPLNLSTTQQLRYKETIPPLTIVYYTLVHAGTGPTATVPASTSTPTTTYTPGDVNHDGVVNIFDYNILLTNFGQTGSNVADINGDGAVNIFDYNILVTNFGK